MGGLCLPAGVVLYHRIQVFRTQHAEREHLCQIAHGRLAAVALPIGIGDEADRGVQRQGFRHGTHAGRIEVGQDALQAEKGLTSQQTIREMLMDAADRGAGTIF